MAAMIDGACLRAIVRSWSRRRFSSTSRRNVSPLSVGTAKTCLNSKDQEISGAQAPFPTADERKLAPPPRLAARRAKAKGQLDKVAGPEQPPVKVGLLCVTRDVWVLPMLVLARRLGVAVIKLVAN